MCCHFVRLHDQLLHEAHMPAGDTSGGTGMNFLPVFLDPDLTSRWRRSVSCSRCLTVMTRISLSCCAAEHVRRKCSRACSSSWMCARSRPASSSHVRCAERCSASYKENVGTMAPISIDADIHALAKQQIDQCMSVIFVSCDQGIQRLRSTCG